MGIGLFCITVFQLVAPQEVAQIKLAQQLMQLDLEEYECPRGGQSQNEMVFRP